MSNSKDNFSLGDVYVKHVAEGFGYGYDTAKVDRTDYYPLGRDAEWPSTKEMSGHKPVMDVDKQHAKTLIDLLEAMGAQNLDKVKKHADDYLAAFLVGYFNTRSLPLEKQLDDMKKELNKLNGVPEPKPSKTEPGLGGNPLPVMKFRNLKL